MALENFSLIRLDQDYEIKPFDCDDEDLNDFLFNDSKPALCQHLAVTYLLEEDGKTTAYFSLLNDKISYKELRTDAFENVKVIFLDTGFDNLQSFPAVKIARLGVNESSKGKGVGRWITDYLKVLFIENNRTGCRFITVDAYEKSLKFYERTGFSYMTNKDEGKPTRLMYFDLQTI